MEEVLIVTVVVLAFYAAVYIGAVVVSVRMAEKRGRNAQLWGWLAVFVWGWLGPIILAIIGDSPDLAANRARIAHTPTNTIFARRPDPVAVERQRAVVDIARNHQTCPCCGADTPVDPCCYCGHSVTTETNV
jgi:hypothetical protein